MPMFSMMASQMQLIMKPLVDQKYPIFLNRISLIVTTNIKLSRIEHRNIYLWVLKSQLIEVDNTRSHLKMLDKTTISQMIICKIKIGGLKTTPIYYKLMA